MRIGEILPQKLTSELDQLSLKEIIKMSRDPIAEYWEEKGIKKGKEIGEKKGLKKGYQKAILKLLRKKFQRIPKEIKEDLEKIDKVKDLEELLEETILAKDLNSFKKKLNKKFTDEKK